MKIIHGINEFIELFGENVEKPKEYPCVVDVTETSIEVKYCPKGVDFSSFLFGIEIAKGYF